MIVTIPAPPHIQTTLPSRKAFLKYFLFRFEMILAYNQTVAN